MSKRVSIGKQAPSRPSRLPPLDGEGHSEDAESQSLFHFDASASLSRYDVPDMRTSTVLSTSKNTTYLKANAPAADASSADSPDGMAARLRAKDDLPPVRSAGAGSRHVAMGSMHSSDVSSNFLASKNTRTAFLKEAFLGDRNSSMSTETERILNAGIGAVVAANAATRSVVPSEGTVVQMLRTGDDAVHYFSNSGKDAIVKFVYLNRASTGDNFRPYDLMVVSKEETDPEHFTMSASGVVHITPEEPAEFFSLAEWVRQSSMFNALTNIRYFRYYLLGKMFRSWRSNVRYKLYCLTREKLASRFFVAKPTFVTTVVEIHKLAVDLRSVKLFHFVTEGQKSTQSPDAFMDAQAQQRLSAVKSFESTVDKIEELLVKLCENVVSRARAPELNAEDDLETLLAQDADGNAVMREAKRAKSMTEMQQEEAEKIRAVKRAQAEAKMLGDFVRLVDYMVVENLIALSMGILKEFMANLQPSDKKKLLFHVNAVYGNDRRKVDLTPGEADLLDMFRKTFDEMVTAVNGVARVLYMRSFKQYFGGRSPTTWFVAGVIRALEEYQLLRSQCEGILQSDCRAAFEYATTLEEFHQWHVFSSKWSVDDYRQTQRTIEEFRGDLNEVKKAISTVEREMKTQAEVGNIFVDSKRLKNTLLPQLGDVLENMKTVLVVVARDKCRFVLEEFSSRIRILEDRPDKLHAFASYVENLNKIKEESWRLLNIAGDVDKMYELLAGFDVKIPTEDQVKHDDLITVQQDFQRALQGSQDHQQTSMSGMAVAMDKTIEQINEELLAMVSQLRSGDYVDPLADPVYVLDRLATVKQTIDQLRDKTSQYTAYQKLFNLAGSSWDNLSAVEKQYSSKLELWQKLHDMSIATDGWKTNPKFTSINVEEVNKEVAVYYKDAYGLQKKLQDGVSERFLKLCEEWKSYMPVVLELGNPAMRPRHWTRIFDALGRPYSPEMDFSLELMLSYGIIDHKEIVSEVSAVASGEYSLEVTLNKIREGWDVTEFTTRNHREQKDIFVLGGVDEIMQLLEDNQVTLQTMMASRFVVGIKSSVEEWEQKLRILQEVLDEWLTCQRNWMYLEFIFSSEDIQRQLPTESMKFKTVDKEWKDIMRRTHAKPNVLAIATAPRTLEMFRNANKILEEVQKSLEDYLETKRAAFPRFYFLSNDELLEILSQTREPRAVQPHLTKCFDSIKELGFKNEESDEIVSMKSAEAEVVPYSAAVIAEGNVENWLLSVETMMRATLYDITKEAVNAYSQLPREEWFFEFPTMSVLCVDQIIWTKEVTESLEKIESGENPKALREYFAFYLQQLDRMVGLVRGKLSKLERLVMGALITLDVHCRDVVDRMVKQNCSSTNDFEWVMQLRYYWDAEKDDCVVRQTNAKFTYGYEYLGNQPRLVITPLTDRCYLTCTGALHLCLGAAPQGPAGTGKTESVKDLAKALARQCVVFNCSDGLDYKMMGRMFSGLAQAGAWACFDEFNRIDIEVLSVIAQQMLTIIQAIMRKADKFLFEGRELALNANVGVFITMNPGYAGRTELPDNLKALFRPVAMMIPDYALIAEIMLFSEGFSSAKDLAQKMVQLFKLSSEQLSKQDHYDFGMRAVKSILVMAGQLKRSEPDLPEDIVLIRAMRDSNVPKFLQDDVILFMAILQDLFPGVSIPNIDYGELQTQIEDELRASNLQIVPSFTNKIIQLYEIMRVRHGVMLVGPTGSGKSVIHNTLQAALGSLCASKGEEIYQKVRKFVLNPKSLTMGELYGEFNEVSHEWTDGLVASISREVVRDTTQERKWVVFDGPVDALWIENMNTVLDDNKMLCLVNGERIKLPPTVSMMFEVQDLAVASPATVSRCGMVYIEPLYLEGGWKPMVRTWCSSMDVKYPGFGKYLQNIFYKHCEPVLDFLRRNCKEFIPTVNQNLVVSCMKLVEALLVPEKGFDTNVLTSGEAEDMINRYFAIALIWSLGATADDASRPKLESYLRARMSGIASDFPSDGSVYDYCVDPKTRSFIPWKAVVQDFAYMPEMPFFNILVPTVDTTRIRFLLDTLVRNGRNVLLTGVTGVGKTVIVQDFLREALLADDPSGQYVSIYTNFSAQTSSKNVQDLLESKFEKKRKNLLGAPAGKQNVVFVDDLNMPALEQYGAQPPIELLRQVIDHGGLYDREKLFFKHVSDTAFVASCGPPGGGRNPVTPRLLRQFHILSVPQLSGESMERIFSSILSGFLKGFAIDVSSLAMQLVQASVSVYSRVSSDLLPTPSKSHYTFNLRDMSKVVQGILQITPKHCPDRETMVKLWCHEACRVFRDRLVDDEDRTWFNGVLRETIQQKFGFDWQVPTFDHVLFGDFIQRSDDRQYQLLTDVEKVQSILKEYEEEYTVEMNKEMNLVFFRDAIEHIARICRVLRQPRGNALLVGVGGSGRQSLTRLAAFASNYKCFTIEITKNYGKNEFRDDLKKVLLEAGCKDAPIVFLFSDTQIVKESFLEDINSILNTGEVPNLFGPEDFEQIIQSVQPKVRAAGKMETRDVIYSHFVYLVRENLHIVLSMSPVGDAFRTRLRMFPALVNNCTIDWYNEWPQDALYSVARRFLGNLDLGSAAVNDSICKLCVYIHSSVSKMSKRYFEELRRYNYTTPTSYLELLQLYTSMLDEQRDKVTQKLMRLKTGLDKLLQTNDVVEQMKVDLKKMQPVLERSATETAELLVRLTADQKQAAEVKANCMKEEAECKLIMDDTQRLKDDCQRDLDKAMPAYFAAVDALNSLNKQDITEIKSFKTPPPLVQTVMEAVCILKGVKPEWKAATGLLADTGFLKSLIDYDKDNIPAGHLKKLVKYVTDPEFTADNVAKVSRAARSLCLWVHAINTYAEVARTVEPKKAALAEATAKLNAAQAQLADKQAALAEVEARVRELQALFSAKQAEKKRLEDEMRLTEVRLERANKLVLGLADERLRWDSTVKQLEQDRANLVGNMLLAAGSIAYLGPFTAGFRNALTREWLEEGGRGCTSVSVGAVTDIVTKVPVSADFSLEKKVGEPVQIRDWNLKGLPADAFSTENGMLLTRGRRWPLMIDPQGQANVFVRNLERANGLKVIKLTDGKFLQTLENCIRIGTPCLLENVGEALDPALEPILLRQTFKRGGQLLIRLGDTDVPYSPQFRFYITTKLPNPHYLPEVCIKVTIINFTVTLKGLEDQLLASVVQFERPDLEQQKDKLVLQIADGQRQLKEIEDKILSLLANSSGDILEDEVLINTLAASKKTSGEINRGVVEAEETAKRINEAREGYRPVARRGSILYFVVADLGSVDPMYQNSLPYFNNLFSLCLKNSEKSGELEKRIGILLSFITEYVYRNVCRGLFEKDKLIFASMMAVQIMKNDGRIADEEWNFFLRGADATFVPQAENPYRSWLSDMAWRNMCALAHACDARSILFTDLEKSFISSPAQWRAYVECESPQSYDDLPAPFDAASGRMTPWYRLLVLKALREEKVIFGFGRLVSEALGKVFVESPPFDLTGAFRDSSPTTPIIFVLSPGADPAAIFLNFAREMGFTERLRMLSLGQGQGPIAEKLIEQGLKKGEWIALQNCHLAASWMPTLERLLEELSHAENVHPDFRLWLTSLPSPRFPVPVLQLGIKLTNEPPKGMRANLRRSFADLQPQDYMLNEAYGAEKQKVFRKLLFGLCFFHSQVQERRKFGALGWNIGYDWNDSDFSASVKSLRNLVEEGATTPWDALRYIIGTINYGGRVTDFLDLRCLQNILATIFSPQIVDNDDYRFTSDVRYYAPPSAFELDDVRNYIAELPAYEEPAVFGLHVNANITFQKKETSYMMSTIISMQPRASGNAGGKSTDQIAFEVAEDILSKVPELIDTESPDKVHPSAFSKDEGTGAPSSLSTVLSQEIVVFNRLLSIMRRTLTEIKKAIRGIVVMSDELEEMYRCFLFQRIPPKWASAYPSLKSLGSWFKDLLLRIDFLRSWVMNGPPSVFWISAFSFPQGFLTAVLQQHARRFKIPIDTLRFRCEVQQQYNSDEIKQPARLGVYISGLFMEGARWDAAAGSIAESRPAELFTPMPVILLEPEDVKTPKSADTYAAPCYKTITRYGALSTTGLSTNFVLSVDLPTRVPAAQWILRGCALVCALAE